MSKFTPGPWETVNGCGIFTALGALNAAGVLASDSDGWHVATCSGGHTFTADGDEKCLSREEDLANAKLVSAAPELYEALKEILECSQSDIRKSLSEKASAAIAKAEGLSCEQSAS